MKISSVGSTKSTSDTKKKRSVTGSGFAALLGVSANAPNSGVEAPNEVAGISAIGGLLAAQEVGQDATSDQALVKQGEDTLDALEKLRMRLLTGAVPLSVLTNLKTKITAQKQHTNDPALRNILNDIELRASVELAKLETAKTNRQAAHANLPPTQEN